VVKKIIINKKKKQKKFQKQQLKILTHASRSSGDVEKLLSQSHVFKSLCDLLRVSCLNWVKMSSPTKRKQIVPQKQGRSECAH
jgi:hypothetical protein